MMAASRPSGRKAIPTKMSAARKIQIVIACVSASNPKSTPASTIHFSGDLPSCRASTARTSM